MKTLGISIVVMVLAVFGIASADSGDADLCADGDTVCYCRQHPEDTVTCGDQANDAWDPEIAVSAQEAYLTQQGYTLDDTPQKVRTCAVSGCRRTVRINLAVANVECTVACDVVTGPDQQHWVRCRVVPGSCHLL